MSRTTSNPNPYKEPGSFFDTFNTPALNPKDQKSDFNRDFHKSPNRDIRDPNNRDFTKEINREINKDNNKGYNRETKDKDLNGQTAQFGSLEQSENLPMVLVLLSGEFERLHGIIQALAIRYKDLESRYEASEHEKGELKLKYQKYGDSAEKVSSLNQELERTKGQVAGLIVQVEELKGRLQEKEEELNLKGSINIKKDGSYGYQAEKTQLESKKKSEFPYNSLPIPESDSKSYDFYSKLYENQKPTPSQPQQQDFFYSPEKAIHQPIGGENRVSGDYEYSEYKSPSQTYYAKEEDFSKKYGEDYGKGLDIYSNKYGSEYKQEPQSEYHKETELYANKYKQDNQPLQEDFSKKFGLDSNKDSGVYPPNFSSSVKQEQGSVYTTYQPDSTHKKDLYSNKYQSEYQKAEDYSNKYEYNLNNNNNKQPSGMAHNLESNRGFEDSEDKEAQEFDYRRGYQYQYYEEDMKY